MNIWKHIVLGIDAAWTTTQPSGISLLGYDGKKWRCIIIAPGYQQFIDAASGIEYNWTKIPAAGSPSIETILKAVNKITNKELIDVIAVDMPLSTEPITARRVADNEVSHIFGNRGCSVHSPSAERPGVIADNLRHDCEQKGFMLSTKDNPVHDSPALIEVYPHTAILELLNLDYRHPYKVSNSTRYWRGTSIQERKVNLLASMQLILINLQKDISDIDLVLPSAEDVPTLSYLKRYEDAIDALVCGWVAIKYLQGQCVAYGDESAAIWTPV